MKKMILIITCFLLLLLLCPIFFILFGSFMSDSELYKNLHVLVDHDNGEFVNLVLPHKLTLESYIKILTNTSEFYLMFLNSIKVVFFTLLGQLLVATPAAWGFAKYKFYMSKSLFVIYITLTVMPFQVMMLSHFLVLENLQLINTLGALIIPGIFSTFPILIMYYNFCSIPNEILEAVRIDGGNELLIFLKIGVPLGRPGIISALVLSFFEYWNLIEQPVIFIKNKVLFPVSVYVPVITPDSAGISFAASILVFLPPFIVFFVGRKYIEQIVPGTHKKKENYKNGKIN